MKSNSAALPRKRIGRPPVDRRVEILDAAERLYDELGFERTTMADIAKTLTMSPANLYRTFPNRRSIDDAIAERQLRAIEDVAWVAARKAAQDAEAAFNALVSSVSLGTADVLFKQGRASDLCMAATRGQWPVVSRYMHGLRGALRHVIVEGQRQGAFDRALDSDATADTLIGALVRVWHPLVLDADGANELDEKASRLGRFLIRALKNET